jgi:hypothetical protein
MVTFTVGNVVYFVGGVERNGSACNRMDIYNMYAPPQKKKFILSWLICVFRDTKEWTWRQLPFSRYWRTDFLGGPVFAVSGDLVVLVGGGAGPYQAWTNKLYRFNTTDNTWNIADLATFAPSGVAFVDSNRVAITGRSTSPHDLATCRLFFVVSRA